MQTSSLHHAWVCYKLMSGVESEVQRRLGRLALRVVGFDVVFLMEDSVYVMRREQQWPEHAQMVGELRERFRKSMLAGGAFGLALTFSLRRYFPGKLSGLTATRLLIESVVVGGSLFGSSISVLLGASKFVHEVKKQHVLAADPQAYQYLQDFKEKYQVDEETQVRYLLSTEEFQEWKKYRTRDRTQN